MWQPSTAACLFCYEKSIALNILDCNTIAEPMGCNKLLDGTLRDNLDASIDVDDKILHARGIVKANCLIDGTIVFELEEETFDKCEHTTY